jgi:hypothetical protein
MVSHKSVKGSVFVFLVLLGTLAAARSFAGSAVIGSVAGSKNATIDGQLVLPHTAIVSGDSLQVNDGAAVVAIGETSRMVFGRQTTASFLREGDEVTVLLSRGDLAMYHPPDGVALRVQVGDVRVMPAKGFKTLGEVAMVGGRVVITAKEGSLRVEGNGSVLEVAKGKTIAIAMKAAATGNPGPARQVGGPDTTLDLEIAATAAGGTAAILAGIAVSRANGARDAANAATASAVAAGNAATAAANAGQATANAVGCAIDKITPSITVNGQNVSPYTPPAGSTC